MSSGKDIDGLWVGVETGEQSTLYRVEDALSLIKRHSPLHYLRVVRNLKRVWVHLVPHGNGCYYGPLEACLLDPRYVLHEATTLEDIASVIVHEATHARVERWGIEYEEPKRVRIEAICRRRELNFLTGLPNSEPRRDIVAHWLEVGGGDDNYFSDANLRKSIHDGNVEALRYLGTPEWIIRLVVKAAAIRVSVLRWIQRVVGPVQQP
jgi:hypothetical protein